MTRPDLVALAREHFSDMQNKMCLAVPVTVGLVEGFAANVAAHERARIVADIRARAGRAAKMDRHGTEHLLAELADELEADHE